MKWYWEQRVVCRSITLFQFHSIFLRNSLIYANYLFSEQHQQQLNILTVELHNKMHQFKMIVHN